MSLRQRVDRLEKNRQPAGSTSLNKFWKALLTGNLAADVPPEEGSQIEMLIRESAATRARADSELAEQLAPLAAEMGLTVDELAVKIGL